MGARVTCGGHSSYHCYPRAPRAPDTYDPVSPRLFGPPLRTIYRWMRALTPVPRVFIRICELFHGGIRVTVTNRVSCSVTSPFHSLIGFDDTVGFFRDEAGVRVRWGRGFSAGVIHHIIVTHARRARACGRHSPSSGNDGVGFLAL